MGRKPDKLCQFCGEPIDPGQEFVYLVEAQEFEERLAPMGLVEMSDQYHGEPLRTCKECRLGIEQNRQDLEEEAAKEQARSRRWGIAFLGLLVIFLLTLLACVIVDLLG